VGGQVLGVVAAVTGDGLVDAVVFAMALVVGPALLLVVALEHPATARTPAAATVLRMVRRFMRGSLPHAKLMLDGRVPVVVPPQLPDLWMDHLTAGAPERVGS
jgi:hypothetical protein